ncbi:hypothetical protein BJX66DRAFT_314953 [Aspergillus keveii]|uniref:Secreted protein n=1 Tax=Aspergillus keveii TaxID=714993 RepID=A0ABR4FQY1_9EURO
MRQDGSLLCAFGLALVYLLANPRRKCNKSYIASCGEPRTFLKNFKRLTIRPCHALSSSALPSKVCRRKRTQKGG